MKGKLHGSRGVVALAMLLGSSAQTTAAPSGCAFVADTSVRAGNGSTIDGDLAANSPDGVVHLGRRVSLADDTRVTGATVDLLNGTSVFDVAANTLDSARGVTIRGEVSTATLPLVTPFCATDPVSCGGPDVRVGKHAAASLAPGSYGHVFVENGGTLSLAAGAYTFCGLRTGRNGVIAIGGGAPTAVAVAGDLVLENGTLLLPAAGAPAPQIAVAGARLKIGAGGLVEAFLVAGRAQASIGRGASVAGALCAETLSTARNVTLGCADAAPPTTSTTPTTSSTTTLVTTASTTTLASGSTTTAVPTTSSTSVVPTSSSTSVAPSTSSTSTTPTSTLPTTSPTSSIPTTSITPTTVLPTTTTTSSSTSTTTITFPLNCGNGDTNTGETCDDGNDSDNDACPSDCRIDACTPLTTTQRFVSVRFAPPEGGLVAGLTLLLDYPEGSVDLPGNGTMLPSGTVSGVPTGAFVSVNDLNFDMKGHAARITVGAGAALAPGQVVRLRFNDCQGATVPTAPAFGCTVLTASDPFLNAVNGVTCSVVVE